MKFMVDYVILCDGLCDILCEDYVMDCDGLEALFDVWNM